MNTYAQIDGEIVVNVVIADADWIANQPGTWAQYDDQYPAGIGWTWDADAQRAIPPEPDDSLGWDEEAWQWITPPLEQ